MFLNLSLWLWDSRVKMATGIQQRQRGVTVNNSVRNWKFTIKVCGFMLSIYFWYSGAWNSNWKWSLTFHYLIVSVVCCRLFTVCHGSHCRLWTLMSWCLQSILLSCISYYCLLWILPFTMLVIIVSCEPFTMHSGYWCLCCALFTVHSGGHWVLLWTI